MQFVRHGPDIPERLLQAHEDGRVVFFCGAGISYPARLPGFSGLVAKVYVTLATTPNAVQQAVIKAGQFDTAIGLLEADIVGGRETVRRALAGILTPDLSAPNAIATHDALLTLAKCRNGHTRLITTNFDRLFEEVIAAKSLPIQRFQAPLLPVPKNRWDGLVYLHGLLGATSTASELDRLVVSSGDFGLAYLTERWAARFVSELFRNYTVCFVGYSINDPVLRYMMDALAADRLLGESPPEMFAFGSFSKGKEEQRANEWRAKNVTPILYREHNRHAYLHKTLRAWAETYRDGVHGKERIVVECAMARPLASTRQDDFVGRLLWALSDAGGLPARRFADLDPVPSLDWLVPLSEERYRHADLGRFGVPPRTTVDDKLTFSLTRRPSPYPLAPLMCLADAGTRGCHLDEVMRQLARWLIRHLDDPALLLWLVKHGGQLHGDLVSWIGQRLDELAKLEREGNTAELARIREGAPSAIPGPLMRILWRLLLTGRVKSWLRDFDLYSWRNRFKRDGLTATLRLELREMLTPRVQLREPFQGPAEDGQSREPERVKELVEWEIVLSAGHVHSSLRDLPRDERWDAALPELLSDVSALLRDALDLMRELGSGEDRSDLSYLHQPSISEHPQNRDFRDWTALIDLTRDAWLATVAQSPARAVLVAESWWHTPYPLFRRLAFFAAAQDNVIPHRKALDWLLSDDNWWLWSVETEREAMRLLVALAPHLDEMMLHELEQAVLGGPPRGMFKEDIELERWIHIVDHKIWLRLAKIADVGTILGSVARDRLDRLSAQYPEWRIAADQRDEFPFWMGDVDEWSKFVAAPRSRRELIEWLRQQPSPDPWQEDDWRQRCRDNFATTACALCALAREGVWPTERWREALQAWSEEKLLKRSWRYMAPILATAPDKVLQTLAHGVSWWLQAIAKTFEGHEALFFAFARRILAQDHQGGSDTDDPVGRAINHPVGHVTEALLRWWYRRSLEDGQGLPEEIKSMLTELCDTQIDKYQHGRVLLAAHVIALFRVDGDWATQHLLPLFDWQRSEAEARAAWEGFLWSPRLYRPLMEKLKPAFLDTPRHYAALGKHDGQYASLLTFAALDASDTFTTTELAAATRALPPDGLHDAAQALVRALEGAGEQRADYWTNRVAPYLHAIWPKTRDNVSPAIAESLARLCVAAQDAFPEALTLLRGWLLPAAHPEYLVHRLQEAGLCGRFPEHALDFLSLVIGDQTQWPSSDLGDCLEEISSVAPDLDTDPRFQQLIVYLRQSGRR
ncbi:MULTISPECIES: anti-phage defense-associated sirtuin Dsr1 [Stenotrophomonas]|uniref:anti-phage defense-associated sirtuin Dsr1 n=1 Tax=Stenotrophomonas TaxID=40323 RepID=UPI0024DE99D8|nr:anti-phage defense-associated sirtuin Dsr1 [Stenotrophomonas sp. BIO128-Bstrain]WIA62933.1 SIR2 family protein [Stenotrophomonas sp. BIO128-Bstrain]